MSISFGNHAINPTGNVKVQTHKRSLNVILQLLTWELTNLQTLLITVLCWEIYQHYWM